MDLLSLFSSRKTETYENPDQQEPSKTAYLSLVDRLSDLKTVLTKDIMIPRALVRALDADVEVDRLGNDWESESDLYFPVYKGDLDRVLGWIGRDTVRNMLLTGHNGSLEGTHEPVESIPDSMPLDHAFLKFVKTSAPLFVVRDDHGNTAGVLYLSDVLEVFFGVDMEPHPAPNSAHG